MLDTFALETDKNDKVDKAKIQLCGNLKEEEECLSKKKNLARILEIVSDPTSNG